MNKDQETNKLKQEMLRLFSENNGNLMEGYRLIFDSWRIKAITPLKRIDIYFDQHGLNDLKNFIKRYKKE